MSCANPMTIVTLRKLENRRLPSEEVAEIPLSICHTGTVTEQRPWRLVQSLVFLEFPVNENHCFGLKVLANAGG